MLRLCTISRVVVVSSTSTPTAVVGATAVRGAATTLWVVSSSSSLPVGWSVSLGDLTQLFINLHALQTKLFDLLLREKKNKIKRLHLNRQTKCSSINND